MKKLEVKAYRRWLPRWSEMPAMRFSLRWLAEVKNKMKSTRRRLLR
jgi:hypothetical protein